MQRLLAMSVQFMDTKLCCAFCNLDRIDDDLGNLSIQFSVKIGKETKNLVAHENCVVWCPEVYQKKDKFMGVESAFKRGQMLKCSECKQKGATIGCQLAKCKRSYHLPCAFVGDCDFFSDEFLISCPEHKDPEPDDGDYDCALCGRGGFLVCCERCVRDFHPTCVTPELKKVPKGSWMCPVCAYETACERCGARGEISVGDLSSQPRNSKQPHENPNLRKCKCCNGIKCKDCWKIAAADGESDDEDFLATTKQKKGDPDDSELDSSMDTNEEESDSLIPREGTVSWWEMRYKRLSGMKNGVEHVLCARCIASGEEDPTHILSDIHDALELWS